MSIKEFIEKELQKRCEQEPQFALKLQNKSKSIDQCIKYIYGEVLHRFISSKSGVQAAAVERDELVNMAVHYYDRSEKKFCVHAYDDVNRFLLRKGTVTVFIEVY